MKRNLIGLFALGGYVVYLGINKLTGTAAGNKIASFEVKLTDRRHYIFNQIMKLNFDEITDCEEERLNGYMESINKLDDQLMEVMLAISKPYLIINKINYIQFYKKNRYNVLNNKLAEVEAYIKELHVKYNID